MRAIRVHHAGDASELRMEEVPTPEPGPDQVLIRTAAIGVNHADLIRRRTTPQASEGPPIPGLDVAGTIEAVGPGVNGWQSGDRVMGLVRGSYAEFVPAGINMVSRLPDGMGFTEAASLPCVFLTAWYGLTTLGRLARGETALVHAAGSGVGIAGIQIANALEARVLTSAGSDAKLTRGLMLGAEAGVNYSSQDVTTLLRELTEGRGVDVVLDNVGGEVFDATLAALAPGGRIVNVGSPLGTRSTLDEQALAASRQEVVRIGVFNEVQEDSERSGWLRLEEWFQDGTFRPVIDRVLPWSEAEAAHRLLQSRAVFGKVVLTLDW